MTSGRAAGTNIQQRLQESLDRLRADIDQVEIWAGALEGFNRPVPDYEPMRQHLLSEQKSKEN